MTAINVCILPRSGKHDDEEIVEMELIIERFLSERAHLKTEEIKHKLFERLK